MIIPQSPVSNLIARTSFCRRDYVSRSTTYDAGADGSAARAAEPADFASEPAGKRGPFADDAGDSVASEQPRVHASAAVGDYATEPGSGEHGVRRVAPARGESSGGNEQHIRVR